MDGVLLSHLKSIEVPASWTVHQFKREFLLPKTGKTKNYVDVLRESEETKGLTSEKADVFVSYAWDLKFMHVMASLPIDKDNPDRYVWMDVFCFREPKGETEASSELFFLRFKEALTAIGKAELVVMPWRDPIPPKRSWCIFEYSVIIENKLDYKCRMAPSDRRNFQMFLRKNRTSSAFFKNILASVNVLAAKAERSADQERILSIVESVGVTKVNDAVKKGLVSWLEDVMSETLDYVTGKQTEDEANVLCAVGFLRNSLAKFDGALVAFEKSLTIHSKLLPPGAETPNTIALKSNIALVLMEQNELRPAEEMLRSVLEWLKSNRDAASKSAITMAIASSNLANALRKLNKFSEAEALYNQALSLFEQFAAKQNELYADEEYSSHRDLTPVQIAICLNNLGRLHQKRGNHMEAESLFRRALEIDENHYGPGHPDLATDMHNLAYSLQKLGRKEEALRYGKQALDIFNRVYGPDHETTVAVAKCWEKRVDRFSRKSRENAAAAAQDVGKDEDESDNEIQNEKQ